MYAHAVNKIKNVKAALRHSNEAAAICGDHGACNQEH